MEEKTLRQIFKTTDIDAMLTMENIKFKFSALFKELLYSFLSFFCFVFGFPLIERTSAFREAKVH